MLNHFGLQHILDGRDKGVIMAVGDLHQFNTDTDRTPTRYAIIKLYRDKKLSAWYDSGKEIILNMELQPGDRCKLVTRDNNCVEWIVDDTAMEAVFNHPITAEQIYKERGKPTEILKNEALAREFVASAVTATPVQPKKPSLVRRVLKGAVEMM